MKEPILLFLRQPPSDDPGGLEISVLGPLLASPPEGVGTHNCTFRWKPRMVLTK